MALIDIKGLKYPDEYFIKFFFKNKLHEKQNLKYLEFGCGNGSNLMLPYEYGGGNKVIGIDYDSTLIEYANHNFGINKNNSSYNFYSEDMRVFAKKHTNIEADVFSLPNIVYYISKIDFIKFLNNCKINKLIKKEANFFIRFRTPRDFRFGLGNRVNQHSYKIGLDNDITGEAGCLNYFYTEIEIIDILREHLNLRDFKVFHIDFENMAQNEDIILNSDIVIWGKIN